MVLAGLPVSVGAPALYGPLLLRTTARPCPRLALLALSARLFVRHRLHAYTTSCGGHVRLSTCTGRSSAALAVPVSAKPLVLDSLPATIEIAACFALILILLARHLEFSIIIVSLVLLPVLVALCANDACNFGHVLLVSEVLLQAVSGCGVQVEADRNVPRDHLPCSGIVDG